MHLRQSQVPCIFSWMKSYSWAFGREPNVAKHCPACTTRTWLDAKICCLELRGSSYAKRM